MSGIAQFEQAKALVVSNATYLPQILQGVLPGAEQPDGELRRWVANFVSWAVTESAASAADRQALVPAILPTLRHALDTEQDLTVLKDWIQAATCLQHLAFRYLVANEDARDEAAHADAVKAKVLSLWEHGDVGVRIACMRFAQRCIVVQSAGPLDPRLVDRNDTSITMLRDGADHPLLNKTALSAEAQGLLDRLCSVTSEELDQVAVMTAAANCLCAIARLRAQLATRIANNLLSYAVERNEGGSDDAATELKLRIFDKTIKLVFVHLLRHNLAGSMGPRLQQFLVSRSRQAEGENPKKRALPDAAEVAQKRIKAEAVDDERDTPVPSVLSIPPLPEGEVALKDVFNLSNDNSLASFDVTTLPLDLALRIVQAALTLVDQDKLNASIDIARARLLASERQKSVVKTEAAAAAAASAAASAVKIEPVAPEAAIAAPVVKAFEMPDAQPLTAKAANARTQTIAQRILQEAASAAKQGSPLSVESIDATARPGKDRHTATSLALRLLLREVELDKEGDAPTRRKLLDFCLADFRDRIDILGRWLMDEWLARGDSESEREGEADAYTRWALAALDGLIPRLEAKDRLLIRFYSELPDLTEAMVGKLETLCLDPDRAALGYTCLQYLILLRPPAREYCIRLVEALAVKDPSESAHQERILKRWRPKVEDTPAPTSKAPAAAA